MLAANVAAARLLLRQKMPALYRIHEQPSAEKLTDLGEFLRELGLSLKGGTQPTAKDYADLLEEVKGRPDFHVIQTVLLRSMMQAVYSHDNVGHFGLAFPAYAHFTSPIRRYPDLMVHRAIKHILLDGKPKDFDYSMQELANMGEHCSALERRADDASRDSADALKCEFMLNKVGDSFNGVIASVNNFGLFVELEEIYVTGLVHITALDRDYFHFDPVGHRLTGERTGKVYRLGDSIRIRVAAVNMDDRKIDFVLDDAAPSEHVGKKRSRKGDKPRGDKAEQADERRGRGRSSNKRRTRETDQARQAPDEVLDEALEQVAEAEQPVAEQPVEKPKSRRAKAAAKPAPKRRHSREREVPALFEALPGDQSPTTPVPAVAPEGKAEAPKKKRRSRSRKKS